MSVVRRLKRFGLYAIAYVFSLFLIGFAIQTYIMLGGK